jgi:hypothetical protein
MIMPCQRPEENLSSTAPQRLASHAFPAPGVFNFGKASPDFSKKRQQTFIQL